MLTEAGSWNSPSLRLVTAQCWQEPVLHSGYFPFSFLTLDCVMRNQNKQLELAPLFLRVFPGFILPGSSFLIENTSNPAVLKSLPYKAISPCWGMDRRFIEEPKLEGVSFCSYCDLSLRNLQVTVSPVSPVQFGAHQKTWLVCM